MHLNGYFSAFCGLADDEGLVHSLYHFHNKASLLIHYSVCGKSCQLCIACCIMVFSSHQTKNIVRSLGRCSGGEAGI